jgi:hypothetical protein
VDNTREDGRLKFKTVQLDDETFAKLKICKEIFILHHKGFEVYMLSNNKITREVLNYYIKTEPSFRHLVDK